MDALTGRALRLALEQPKGWEYYLFVQVIEDEVRQAVHLRDEHRDNLALELGEDVSDPIAWARHRIDELQRIVVSLSSLMNVCAARAIGPTGVPANTEDLIFVGHAVGRAYQATLKWSRRVRTANLPEKFSPLKATLAKFTDDIITEIEAFGPRSHVAIDDALAVALTGATATLHLTMTARLSSTIAEEFDRDLKRCAKG